MDEEMVEHMLPVSFVRFGVLILASHDSSAEVPAKETKGNLLLGL